MNAQQPHEDVWVKRSAALGYKFTTKCQDRSEYAACRGGSGYTIAAPFSCGALALSTTVVQTFGAHSKHVQEE